MPRYKYASAHEWFDNWFSRKVDDAVENGLGELHQIATSLAGRLDSDSIQDLFQSDMEADGFFVDLDKTVTQEQYDKIVADKGGDVYCAECKQVTHFETAGLPGPVMICGVCGEELEVTE